MQIKFIADHAGRKKGTVANVSDEDGRRCIANNTAIAWNDTFEEAYRKSLTAPSHDHAPPSNGDANADSSEMLLLRGHMKGFQEQITAGMRDALPHLIQAATAQLEAEAKHLAADQLTAKTAMDSNTGTLGGFLAPHATAHRLPVKRYVSPFERLAFRVSTSDKVASGIPLSASAPIVAGSASASAANMIGGHSITITDTDSQAVTAQATTFASVEFKAKQVVIHLEMTRAMRDGMTPEMWQSYQDFLLGVWWWAVDHLFLQDPKDGLVTNGSTIAQTRSAGSTIAATDVAAMLARLWINDPFSCRWFASSSALPQVAKIGRLEAGPQHDDMTPWGLLALPLNIHNGLPALNTVGDIILVDLSQYGLFLPVPPTIEMSGMGAAFTRNSIEIKVRGCVDGKLLANTTKTPAAGNSLSPCVTLAAG